MRLIVCWKGCESYGIVEYGEVVWMSVKSLFRLLWMLIMGDGWMLWYVVVGDVFYI